MREKLSQTSAWEYYQQGRQYNQRLSPSQYALVNTNIEFYAGNQWLHLPGTAAMASLPKPVFNVIKRVTNVQVANLMASGFSIRLEPLSYYDGSSAEDPDSEACAFAQAELDNLINKLKLQHRAREALFDGAITGDYCAHLYFDPTAIPYGGRLGPDVRGEIKMELVDGINVMFGNPNSRDVESQPYILVIGRDTCDSLNDEMDYYRSGKDDGIRVSPDSDTENQVGNGGKTELSTILGHGKATYVYLYRKFTKKVPMVDLNGDPVMEPVLGKDKEPVQEVDKKGKPVVDSYGLPVYKMHRRYEMKTTVHVSKYTRYCTIYEDIDTGLTHYPVAWGNWEHQKNQYHGRALVTGVIPNQIFINSMFALCMRHTQLEAFPKRAYNADLISQWSNEVGVDIAVRNMPPNMNLSSVIQTLQGNDFSQQILYLIDKAMEYTKECLGSTDAQLGSANIETTSALMVLDTNSRTPLDNPRDCFNEWLEDISAILLDMMATYYGRRPIVRSRTFEEPVMDANTGMPMMGQYDGRMQTKTVSRRVIEEFDFSTLKHLFFSMRCEAGTGNVYSQAAMMQTLDNLRKEGVIEFIDYLERVPDAVIPRKQELIQKLKGEAAVASSGVPAGEAFPMESTAGNVDSGARSVLQQMNPDKVNRFRKPGEPAPTVDDAIAQMPMNVRQQFDELPSRAKGEVAKMAASRMQK